ncbi:hypothetical protein GF337_15180 [candidate division KSB1 bacterium]|nr:hypothetical protein [candidate division KSB1 bacterium]
MENNENSFPEDLGKPLGRQPIEKKWLDNPFVKLLAFMLLLYMFFLSIGLIGSAFKFFGKDLASQLIATTSNPFVGLLIGVLATSLIQSSSTTTSLVVGLVGAGALSVQNAIPIIMGANIGTSVTNTLVSVGHLTRKEEFKRAFAASTVHDFFNIVVVIILFPIQYFTNILGHVSEFLSNQFLNIGGLKFSSPIKIITAPAQHFIEHLAGESGIIILIIALVLLFTALKFLVTTLKAIFAGKLELFFDKYIFKTPIRGIIFGMIITALVQSSSITTSMVVPLAGAGLLTLEQIFPYTLGANIGTTITAFLASLATNNVHAIAVAFAHLAFNILGVVFVYPLKTIPISLARLLAKYSLKSKLIPLLYILIVFFGLPITLIYITR